MKVYLDLLSHILEQGNLKQDRTKIGVKSIFGYQIRFNLNAGFPLTTTKKLHFKSIIYELLWFLQGSTNIGFLKENNVRIWDEWANDNGDLGPIYGKQWLNWETPKGEHINQIQNAINTIKTNPDSRRIIVNSWNPADLPYDNLSPHENIEKGKMALAVCHAFFQFYVADNKLSCHLYQRSADCFLGVPFNIASYALLTHMFAQQCDLEVGDFVWSSGDTHLYSNTFAQSQEQITRKPYPLPSLRIVNKPKDIFSYQYDDFVLENYECHPHIKAAVAV